MNPNEPLDQVCTHPWWTLGQRPGQNRLNRWRQRMSSGTFAAFSKIHLNTSKYTFMKVVHLVEGHNFHVEWHFKFWVEIGEKLDRLTVPPVFQNRPAFKVGTTFLQNPSRKTLDGLYKSCRGVARSTTFVFITSCTCIQVLEEKRAWTGSVWKV
jgi:hypothetical protein